MLLLIIRLILLYDFVADFVVDFVVDVVVDLLLLISVVCELIRASPSLRFESAVPGGSSGTMAVIGVSNTYDPPGHRCLKHNL